MCARYVPVSLGLVVSLVVHAATASADSASSPTEIVAACTGLAKPMSSPWHMCLSALSVDVARRHGDGCSRVPPQQDYGPHWCEDGPTTRPQPAPAARIIAACAGRYRTPRAVAECATAISLTARPEEVVARCRSGTYAQPLDCLAYLARSTAPAELASASDRLAPADRRECLRCASWSLAPAKLVTACMTAAAHQQFSTSDCVCRLRNTPDPVAASRRCISKRDRDDDCLDARPPAQEERPWTACREWRLDADRNRVYSLESVMACLAAHGVPALDDRRAACAEATGGDPEDVIRCLVELTPQISWDAPEGERMPQPTR